MKNLRWQKGCRTCKRMFFNAQGEWICGTKKDMANWPKGPDTVDLTTPKGRRAWNSYLRRSEARFTRAIANGTRIAKSVQPGDCPVCEEFESE